MRVRASLIATVSLLLGAGALRASDADLDPLPPSLSCRYGVIGLRAVAHGPDTLIVRRVLPGSPAAQAGIRTGDRILGMLPYRTRTTEELSRCVNSVTPGDALVLVVVHDGLERKVTCRATDLLGLYPIMSEHGGRAGDRTASRHRRWSAATWPEEGTAAEALRRQGAAKARLDLEAALSFEAGRHGADGRLEDVHYLLQRPLQAATVSRDLAMDLTGAATLTEVVRQAALHLDLALEDATVAAAASGPDRPRAAVEELLLRPLAVAGLRATEAMSDLSPAERNRLDQGLEALRGHLERAGDLDDADSLEIITHRTTVRLAKRVRLAPLMEAAMLLGRIASPPALAALHRATRRLPTEPLPEELDRRCSGELRYVRRTEGGWVVIGGPGPNVYAGELAAIVDLGGNDLYLGSCASPQTIAGGPGPRVGLVVDFAGDDVYLGDRRGGPGVATGGVSLLVDLNGDDLYAGIGPAQGSGICGVGLLYDRQGDDTYVAGPFSQGAGLFGAGLLLDRAGADRYVATQMSQGSGGPSGIGLLLDEAGADLYATDLGAPSAYGTAGIYQAWSQGTGYGWRGLAPGGLGLLVDRRGNDLYRSGEFSQGAGFYFGLGVLVDDGGRDWYLGARYTQGAAAHQAAGVLIEGDGDDRYVGAGAASQGTGWDTAIGLLVDGKGDDTYLGDELSQGAAAMNGLGMLLDRSGRDHYRTRSGQALGGSTAYWGGRNAPNLGLLIDEGNGCDAYSLPTRMDGCSWSAPGLGIFIDR